MISVSEAMLLGSMWKPQGFGIMMGGEKTCAMGAAYEAVNLTMNDQLPDEWRWLLSTYAFCPACPSSSLPQQTMWGIIVRHLNDQHRWTREHIAEWIKTIETELAKHEVKVFDKQKEMQHVDSNT